ncbi:hypothetical protein AA101099_0088 [Neoasaia chiangmaiensis NBRC 101099]|nr:hypothetical protein AA101099_0088 [Neoasaia chiangmaiensis NBRC 101099]
MQDFLSLTRRIGKLIAAAMKRENAAEERRILLRRLSESQKLDVAGTTAVAMAHNLNNVLAAMLGQTEVALDALRNQPRGYNAVMAIRNASERAAELIESILGFGQRDITSAPISMSRLTNETLELLRPAIPERITITFEDRGDEERVHGRATELQQVILNLLRNGMQAIPDRGRIVLRIEVREGHGRLAMQIGALEERPYLVVEVKDTGVGIDPASHATIFRPFHTTRPAGTGLGLSTVADIVSDHNGAIRIVDPPEGGTTFEVWLPISREIEGRPALENGTGQPVLIVARDAVRERFEDIVAALNYEPEGYASIDAALGAIAYDPLRPCAIMLCTERADLDGCIVMAERFRSLPGALPLTILMPGRMSATPLGQIAGRPMWLAGSENNSAIAACMRLMADAAVLTPQGATK